MTVATEQEQVVSLFEDVESLEVLAATFDVHDEDLDVLESLRIPPVHDRTLRFWRECRLGDIE